MNEAPASNIYDFEEVAICENNIVLHEFGMFLVRLEMIPQKMKAAENQTTT